MKKMSSRWFTSDQHYGHARVIEHCNRPFKNVEEMNETLINNHNSTVGLNDEIYHLGDFSLDPKSLQDVSRLLEKGSPYLIPGNHDLCHPCHKKSSKMMIKEYFGNFITIMERQILTDNDLGRVFLCHLPLLSDPVDSGPEARYSGWRPTVELMKEIGCNVLLHGHLHNLRKNAVVDGIKCLNVGVDVRDFKPVSAAQLAKEIKEM